MDQVFGQDAGFGYGGHEVGVAGPAGHGVQMEVAGNAGSGGLAHIEAEVEAVGRVNAFESRLGALGQLDEFVRGFSGQRGQPVEVRVGHDHDVAGGVGIGVEADKAVLPRRMRPAASSASSAFMPLAMA